MPPERIERLFGIRPPELDETVRRTLDDTYDRLLLEITGQADAPFDDEYTQLVRETPMESLDADKMAALVGLRLTAEVRHIIINYPRADDIFNVGKAFIERTDALTETLKYGKKITGWLEHHPRTERSWPYSHEHAASCAYIGVRTALDIQTAKQWRELIWHLHVPPAFRTYPGNQV
jgi:hypothetical protein